MCGIVGWLGRGALPDEGARRRSLDTLRHRGPDDRGQWSSPADGIWLGHHRLSIVDPSPRGHQPMVSASGGAVITYNGEIYGTEPLRAELVARGPRLRGSSDTELLLEAIELLGLAPTLARVQGMFAFALWDRRRRRLYLVRDRLGKKPLYVAVHAGRLAFASELKALRALGFPFTLDRCAVAGYFRHGYVPAPRSIFAEVVKLPPGTSVSLGPDDLPDLSPRDLLARRRPYWCAAAIAEAGQRGALPSSSTAAVRDVEAAIRRAVAERMVADVDVGAFLSGGIDSSLIVALMQAESARPVRTFTIGVPSGGLDEAPYARAVAERLGTEHTELYISDAQARDVIPCLPEVFDEPFADSSQIPALLIASLARSAVGVALTGDGGDEIFGGYSRYLRARRLRLLCRLPAALRGLAAGLLDRVGPARLTALLRLLPRHAPGVPIAIGLQKLTRTLALPDERAMYEVLVSRWLPADRVVRAGAGPEDDLAALTAGPVPELNEVEHWMMWRDSVSYLPDDILVKVDRASMSVGLEARCPLLDQRVVELAWRLPLAAKIQGGRGKRVLREILYGHLPAALFERPKTGFAIPIGAWLRGPLRDWAEDLLAPVLLGRHELLRGDPIRRRWREHLDGRNDWGEELWTVLMFQAWLASAR